MVRRRVTEYMVGEATIKVRESINGAFHEDGDICFNALKTLKTLKSGTKSFLQHFIDLNLITKNQVNQYLKPSQPLNSFSSPLDRFSPQWYQHYDLVEKPLITYELKLIDSDEYEQIKVNPGDFDGTLYCKIGSSAGEDGLFFYASNGSKGDDNKLIYQEFFLKKTDFNLMTSLAPSNANITQDQLTQALPQILEKTSAHGFTRAYDETSHAYLSIKMGEDEQSLNYSIRKSNGVIVEKTLPVGNCLLVKWDETPLTPVAVKKKISDCPPHQVLIKRQDSLYWFHEDKIKQITPSAQTQTQYLELCRKFDEYKDNTIYIAEKAPRERISAILSSSSGDPVTFEVDQVLTGLEQSKLGQYDGCLDHTIVRIQRDAESDMTPFDLNQLELESRGAEFLQLLRGEIGQEALSQLYGYELFRYYMAYVNLSAQKNTVTQKLKTAFSHEAKQKILKDTIDDLNLILKKQPPIYPKETIDLAYIMMDKIRLQADKKNQIADLRRLRELLRTSWAMGTALTQDVDSEPLDAKAQTIAPYVQRKVSIRQPLAFDENMPNYSPFRDLLERFKVEVRQYNIKADEVRARAALKTKFFVPKDDASWDRCKRSQRNCFILYEGKLYHINTDKTLSVIMPFDIQQLIWKKTVHQDQTALHRHMIVKDVPPSKAEREALDDDKMFLIHDHRTNSYTIGYKQNNQYTQKPLNALLGKDVPFDPSLMSAREALEKAVHAQGVSKFVRSTLAQLPKSGQYFSLVHQGKLNFHRGYQCKIVDPNRDVQLEEGVIYLSKSDTGQWEYSIITPLREIVRNRILTATKLPEKGVVRQLELDNTLRQSIIKEIAENGHAYKNTGVAYDPHTMAHKLRTDVGYQDSMQRYRINREKQRSAYREMRENMQGGWSEERREGMLLATRMARGELSQNHRLRKRVCGMALYQTLTNTDLSKDEEFLQRIQAKDQDMYYLQMKPDGADLKPVALYFVDCSGVKPIVTKVEAKETKFSKAAEASQGGSTKTLNERLEDMLSLSALSDMITAAKPKEDQTGFYQNIYNMFKAAEAPETQHQDSDDPWIKIGLNHAGRDSVIYYFKADQEELLKKEEEIVRDRVISHGQVLFMKFPTKTRLYYQDKDKNLKFSTLDAENKEHQQLINASQSGFLLPDIDRLNDFLEANDSPTRIPPKILEIKVISTELEEAINAETKEVYSKAQSYDDQLQQYAQDEVSNQLSYVIAQRTELRERYQRAQAECYQRFLLSQGYTVLPNPTEPMPSDFKSEEQKAYFDSQKNIFIVYKIAENASIAKEEKTAQDLGITPEDEPKIDVLHQALLAEQYQVRRLDVYEHEKLIAWMASPHGEPPFELEKGILYLTTPYREGELLDCFGIDPAGKLQKKSMKSTTIKIDKDDTDAAILKKLLPHTEEAGITLSAQLVDPGFLARCGETQRFLDKISRGGWFSIESVLPQEKREKLLRMMTAIAINPDSSDAKHYLRNYHNMYITSGRPQKHQDDNDPTSFYLDIKDSKHPVLYRFLGNQSTPVEVKLENYYSTTPAKELYKIAKAQLKTTDLEGKVVKLSTRDVYYHITCQSKQALKMDTAAEMIEEIYQREFGVAKVLENAVFAVLAAGMGLSSLFMGNFAGAVAGVWAVIGSFVTMMSMSVALLASLVCARAAVVNNGWFGRGLPELAEQISKLESLDVGSLHESKEEIGLKATVISSTNSDSSLLGR